MRIVMDLTEKVRAHVSIRERSSQENVTLGSGNSVYRLKMPSSNLTCHTCLIHMKISAICAGHQ